MPEVEKQIIIIAGPNGAGKTTFAREFLPNEAGCPIFVNADLIADGLSSLDPNAAAVRAGRLMIKEIRLHAEHRESFAFETTTGWPILRSVGSKMESGSISSASRLSASRYSGTGH